MSMPDREVMGTRVHVPTDPPAGEGDPSLQVPRRAPRRGADDPMAVLAAENAERRLRAQVPMPRQPSQPDSEDSVVRHRLNVLERDRDRLEEALPRLEGKVTAVEIGLANLTQEVKLAAARTSSETVKIIVAGVVTVVTAVVGARVTAPEQKPLPNIVQKSQAELETQTCNAMPDPKQKGECLAGVVNRLVEANRR